MKRIIIIQSAPLMDLSEIKKAIKAAYPFGVCINLYKLAEMSCDAHYSDGINNRAVLYVSTVMGSFIKMNYCPVVLVGWFTLEQINYLGIRGGENVTISLFVTKDVDIGRKLNRIKYQYINEKDLLTRCKSKRMVRLYENLAYEINKNIYQNSHLSDFAFDISESICCLPRKVLSCFE